MFRPHLKKILNEIKKFLDKKKCIVRSMLLGITLTLVLLERIKLNKFTTNN